MTYYHVCDCGTKWFCPDERFPCPRCGAESESTVQQQPPWLKKGSAMKNTNGKYKTTREEFERSKKILARWEEKVVRAKAIVKFWEKVEATNRKRIGENVLMSITQDLTGTTIHCESPARVSEADEAALDSEIDLSAPMAIES
jgi:hypothetical protein